MRAVEPNAPAVKTADDRSRRSVVEALLDSRWFYAIAVTAVLCGPLLIPGFGLKLWFLLLVGGGVFAFLAILIAGVIFQIARRPDPRRHTRRPTRQ